MADLQNPPPDWLQTLIGMRLSDVIFGAAGGTVRGLVVQNLSLAQRVGSTAVGALTAGSLAPAANAIAGRWLEWWGFRLSPAEIGGSVIFIIGLIAMTLCDGVIRVVIAVFKRWLKSPPSLPMPPK